MRCKRCNKEVATEIREVPTPYQIGDSMLPVKRKAVVCKECGMIFKTLSTTLDPTITEQGDQYRSALGLDLNNSIDREE